MRRTGNSDDQGGVFESFSDMMLSMSMMLITIIVLFAINLGRQLLPRFSGGASRPALHFQAEVVDYSQTQAESLALQRALYGGEEVVVMHLFSPSVAASDAEVREGRLVTRGAGETFEGQLDLTAFEFLKLAPAINPGQFPVDDPTTEAIDPVPTSLLVPNLVDKMVDFEPELGPSGYKATPNKTISRTILTSVWPLFENRVYPVRKQEEYADARTQIHVQTETVEMPGGTIARYVVIGHHGFRIPRDIENGRLAWMTSLASRNTEIVYLGDLTEDPEEAEEGTPRGENWHPNRRIQFFESAGYDECAQAYRRFVERGLGGWSEQHEDILERVKAEEAIANRHTESELRAMVRAAVADIHVSKAVKDGEIPTELMPPLLVYPEAWQAYIEDCLARRTQIPIWFHREFLEPIGFDRGVIKTAGAKAAPSG